MHTTSCVHTNACMHTTPCGYIIPCVHTTPCVHMTLCVQTTTYVQTTTCMQTTLYAYWWEKSHKMKVNSFVWQAQIECKWKLCFPSMSHRSVMTQQDHELHTMRTCHCTSAVSNQCQAHSCTLWVGRNFMLNAYCNHLDYFSWSCRGELFII